MKNLLIPLIFWYLIGAFVASTFNPLEWLNIGKIIYILFVFWSWDGLNEKYK